MAEIVIYPVPVIVDTATLILGCALEAVTLVTLVTNVNAIIEVIFLNLSFFQIFVVPFLCPFFQVIFPLSPKLLPFIIQQVI